MRDDLTRENIMRPAANIKDLSCRCCCRGFKINTSPTDFFPVKPMQLMRFNGTQWVLFGDIIG